MRESAFTATLRKQESAQRGGQSEAWRQAIDDWKRRMRRMAERRRLTTKIS